MKVFNLGDIVEMKKTHSLRQQELGNCKAWSRYKDKMPRVR